jgi:hypothetical protein
LTVAVSYQFEITTVAGGKRGTGLVSPSTDEAIEQGTYRLFADGQILKVKNLGGVWTILGS